MARSFDTREVCLGEAVHCATVGRPGQRLFFLHDGRTSDVLEAILAHASAGSEANAVIRNFQALSPSQKQDVLNFLRSL